MRETPQQEPEPEHKPEDSKTKVDNFKKPVDELIEVSEADED